MTREEILKSRELSKTYANELAGLLRVLKDKDVAQGAARANVSAVALGRERPVTREALRGVGEDRLRQALARAGSLDELRQDLGARPERERPLPAPFQRLRDSQEYER